MVLASEMVRIEAHHAAMGTMYSIIAYAPSSVSLSAAIRHAFDEVDRLEAMMSRYRPSSEICAINREAFKAPVAVTPELFALLEKALRLCEETGGAFDVTVGPLVRTWGFFRGRGRLPSDKDVAHALEITGFRHVKLNPESNTVAFDRPGIELDLGAIGKGYAVDRVVDLMYAQGVSNALVSSGASSIAAIGAPPGERHWKVCLCDPFDPRKELRTLRLRNLSISISGGFEKMFRLDGKAYTHLLDPRSGRSVAEVLMTAVIGRNNALNDALSTAFSVLGAERTREYLDKHSEFTVLMFSLAGLGCAVNQSVIASKNSAHMEDGLFEVENA